jgi:hypothetical protein
MVEAACNRPVKSTVIVCPLRVALKVGRLTDVRAR